MGLLAVSQDEAGRGCQCEALPSNWALTSTRGVALLLDWTSYEEGTFKFGR